MQSTAAPGGAGAGADRGDAGDREAVERRPERGRANIKSVFCQEPNRSRLVGLASPHRPSAVIGDENAGRAPAFSKEWSCAMQGHRFEQLSPLQTRLTDEAQRLRKEARGTPAGVKRDMLIRQARLAETAARMQEWMTSPGLQAPR
jgi:hypothetical protein